MNDVTYYNQLFNCYRPVIYRQAFRMTRSTWHAEEIVQEVFIRVWKHRDELEQIKNMKVWLFVITKNIVFSYLVKISKDKKFFGTYMRTNFANNADALLFRKCLQLMAAAEQKLTPRQKQVFELRFLKGMRQKEIAGRLRISPFTVKAHLKTSVRIVKRSVLQQLDMAA